MTELYRLQWEGKIARIASQTFGKEKELQEIVERNTEELFGLKFVKSEFKVGQYRIDTLCFDERARAFAIVEYKKSKDAGIIDQGHAYAATMKNRKREFLWALDRSPEGRTFEEAEINWKQSRIIFISPSFSDRQKDAVSNDDIGFELWEVIRFSDGLISFNPLASGTSEGVERDAEARVRARSTRRRPPRSGVERGAEARVRARSTRRRPPRSGDERGAEARVRAEGVGAPSRMGQKREPFRFSMVGVAEGAMLEFKEDRKITAVVAGDKKILFEGKETSLSTAAKEIMARRTGETQQRQGPSWWVHRESGKLLSELREEVERRGS